MKEQIIETAGRVWRLLQERERVDISRLPRLLGCRTLVVHQALGWLAREDKLSYAISGGRHYVALVPGEKGQQAE